MDIIVTYGTFSIIFILVTTDVAVSVCGRSGLWPFRFVAVSVCGRFGLWPFRSVAVPVCGRFGLWPFRFVAVPVCGRFGCGRFGLWPLWPVTLPGPELLLVYALHNGDNPKTMYANTYIWGLLFKRLCKPTPFLQTFSAMYCIHHCTVQKDCLLTRKCV